MAEAPKEGSNILGPDGSSLVTSGLDQQFKMLKNIAGSTGGGPGGGSALVNISHNKLVKMASDMRPGMHRQTPSFYHPLFEAINLQLPSKNREIFQWCRHFYRTDGYVGTLIDTHCFVAGSPVYMADGIKNIEDVVAGDMVTGSDGKSKLVKKTASHDYCGMLHKIIPIGLPEFSVTHNERMMVVRGKYDDKIQRVDKNGKIRNDNAGWVPVGGVAEWVRAEDVNVGDYLFFPKRVASSKDVEFDLSKFVRERSVKYDMVIRNQTDEEFPQAGRSHVINQTKISRDSLTHVRTGVSISRKLKPSDELCELGGWWVAEGYSDGNSVNFCLGMHEPENIARVAALIRNVFGLEPKFRRLEEHHGVQIYVCSNILAKWFWSEFGAGCKNKKIPSWLIDGELSWLRSFLRGYLNGDGCLKSSKYTVTSNTVSRTLAYQMELVAARLGFLFSAKLRLSRKDGKKMSPIYYMQAPTKEVMPKVYGIAVNIRTKRTSYVEVPGGFLVRVGAVDKSEFNGPVYDIETENGSFCAPVVVHNSSFPLTGMHVVCDDPKVKRFFEILFFDILKGPRLLEQVNLEYWKLGSAFPFGNWDDDKGIWTGFKLLNPDFVEVETSSLADEPVLKLDPDDNLKRIVSSRQPKELYEQLAKIENGELVNLVARGEKIPLNKFRVSQLAFKLSPYETVGTPIMFRAFKPLIAKDYIRRVQMAVYERHILPLKLIKVGSDTMPANPEAIKQVREAMDELSTDLSAWFIYHHAISAEYVSSSGKIHPFDNESKWVREEILAALMGNDAMIGGGGTGSSFASASIGMQLTINRYMRNQRVLADWVKDTIFRPVAIAQDFKRQTEWGEEYIVPDIEFDFMKLKDDAQMKNLMKELMKTGLISKQSFYVYMGMDGDREQKQIKREKAAEKADVLKGIKPAGPPAAPGAPGGAPPMGGGGDMGGAGPEIGGEPPTPGVEMPASEMPPGGSEGGQGPGFNGGPQVQV